jgi:NADH:ubiquinone oxidoreductase subunit 6 (subunit J)
VQHEPSVAGAVPESVPEGTPVAAIGKSLVTEWVVPLEILAVLLTAALIGAVVIALEEVNKRS